ncbi:hypothetical protein LCGC14_2015120 [marine sediment metagenome]|uniref:Uncharacterized protein n=1 Tax=marine sediment metagenome TaxID=412755 RepID=A0A0F9FLM4_9ZZZZ
MSIPNYAIELSLMLYHNNHPVRTFTFYNHGAEPPYGGVRADAVIAPLVMTMEGMKNADAAVDAWIRNVIDVAKLTTPVTKSCLPDLPYENKIDDTDGIVEYNMEMETLSVSISYEKSTFQFTFAARGDFDISWRAFMFYRSTIKGFIQRVSEL